LWLRFIAKSQLQTSDDYLRRLTYCKYDDLSRLFDCMLFRYAD
jgi:hypothetical protein